MIGKEMDLKDRLDEEIAEAKRKLEQAPRHSAEWFEAKVELEGLTLLKKTEGRPKGRL